MTLAVCSVAEKRWQNWRGFFASVRVLLLASGLIVITHLAEVGVWAVFFVVRDAFPTTSAAFNYSLLQYTTAGSELSLPDRWRLLAFNWATQCAARVPLPATRTTRRTSHCLVRPVRRLPRISEWPSR